MTYDFKEKIIEDSNKVVVKKGDVGAATQDIQRKLVKLGYLSEEQVTSIYDNDTEKAIEKFSKDNGLTVSKNVSEKAWALMVDGTFELGDRNLFLRIPYFHGNDVKQLQKALGSLGFDVMHYDGIFGASTEQALRHFQANMGIPADGIAGSQTFMAIKNLQFTWSDKNPLQENAEIEKQSIWRASEVLEDNSICIFGTDAFTRDVAQRMSNLARATNPFSKVLNSNAYSVAPDKNTMLLHICLPSEKNINQNDVPRVNYCECEDEQEDVSEAFITRLINGIEAAKKSKPARISIELPGKTWLEAKEDRSAQHFAITTLDALCSALEKITRREND